MKNIKQDNLSFDSQTDVIILNLYGTDLIEPTIKSLQTVSRCFKSITLVSALSVSNLIKSDIIDDVFDKHDDFFEVFVSLKKAFDFGKEKNILLLEAGARIKSGFFTAMKNGCNDAALYLSRIEEASDKNSSFIDPPLSIEPLIADIHNPPFLYLSRNSYVNSGGLDSALLGFSVWELLIRLYKDSSTKPIILSDALEPFQFKHTSRNFVEGYKVFLDNYKPDLSENLPDLNEEAIKLYFVLLTSVIEKHSDLYSRYMTAIIPKLITNNFRLKRWKTKFLNSEDRRIVAENNYKRAKLKREEAESAYKKAKKQKIDVEEAYRLLKESISD